MLGGECRSLQLGVGCSESGLGRRPLGCGWEETHGSKTNGYLQADSSSPAAPTLPFLSCVVLTVPLAQDPLYIQTGSKSNWYMSTSTEIDKLYHIKRVTEDALETFPGLSDRGPDGLVLPSDSHLRPKHPGFMQFRTTEGSLLHLMTIPV